MLGNTNSYADYDSYAAGKANVGLENLSAAGQMIIDSQNGTMSNCILEIPQNIKVTLENNILTHKSGSILVNAGSTYSTLTLGTDKTLNVSSLADGIYFINPAADGTPVATLQIAFTSGNSLSLSANAGDRFFKTDDKTFWSYSTQWNASDIKYPTCLIEMKSGVASFAKFSDGRDCIFNGIGFVGQTKFIYPNVKVLEPIGKNADGTLKSREFTNNSLQLSTSGGTYNRKMYINGNVFQITNNPWYYDENTNLWYDQINIPFVNGCICLGNCYTVNGIVTDFTIRQPYEGAANLLTKDIKEQIGDIDTALTTIIGA